MAQLTFKTMVSDQWKKFFVLGILSASLFSVSARAEKVVFLSNSSDAFHARIDMINSAESEIFAEYFSVWNDDQSVQLLSLMLDKARHGIKVKLIFDALASKLPKSLIAALQAASKENGVSENLEIRFYNPFNIFMPARAFHREHAKMLIIDGKKLIIGGRNIGDKYFGWNKKRNFIDADVLMQGPVPAKARANFLKVWDSKVVKAPGLYNYKAEKLAEGACLNAGRDYSKCESDRRAANKEVDQQLQRSEDALASILSQAAESHDFVAELSHDWFQNAVEVPSIQFFSHEPEQLVSEKTNTMTKDLIATLLTAENDVLIASPYLFFTPEIEATFNTLLKVKKVKIRVLTNSLMSTDNVLAQAGYKSVKKNLIAMGFDIYEYNGPDTAHAKMIVIDGKKSVVGTFNLNKRSANHDREVGVLMTETTESHPLADQITAQIEEYMENSVQVSEGGKAINQDKWVENDPNLPDSLRNKLNFSSALLPLFQGQL